MLSLFWVNIFDSSGLNITGETGHEIELYIDNDEFVSQQDYFHTEILLFTLYKKTEGSFLSVFARNVGIACFSDFVAFRISYLKVLGCQSESKTE